MVGGSLQRLTVVRRVPDERQQRFDGALAADPGNVGLFYSAMISALPRWEGKDEKTPS